MPSSIRNAKKAVTTNLLNLRLSFFRERLICVGFLLVLVVIWVGVSLIKMPNPDVLPAKELGTTTGVKIVKRPDPNPPADQTEETRNPTKLKYEPPVKQQPDQQPVSENPPVKQPPVEELKTDSEKETQPEPPKQQDAPPEVPNDLPPAVKQDIGEGRGEGKDDKKMDEVVNVNLLSDQQKEQDIASKQPLINIAQQQEPQAQEDLKEKELARQQTGDVTQRDQEPAGEEDRPPTKIRINDENAPQAQQEEPPTPPEERKPSTPEEAENLRRRAAIKEMFLHAWKSYKQHAWGFDELRPHSKTGFNWLGQGLGATIVDSLSTMSIMGLQEEFDEARDWVEQNLSNKFKSHASLSLFECVIRILGGLISAYDLSGDNIFLEKAKELADRIMPAFSTGSGIPRGSINLGSGTAQSLSWTGGRSVLAEVGTLQIEFVALAQRVKDPAYAKKVLKIVDVLAKADKRIPGLYPLYVGVEDGHFSGNSISLGALGDSFYEYLIKMYVMTGHNVPRFKTLYEESSSAIIDHMVRMKGDDRDYTWIAQLNEGRPVDQMDHLACFAAGMFALGSLHVWDGQESKKQRDMEVAKGVGETCFKMYDNFPLKISPESVYLSAKRIDPAARYYILRPEAIEAWFYLWRFTKNPMYREWGWIVAEAINKTCRVENGFCGIKDVVTKSPVLDDTQQSFFLAETLKYLYLLFSDDDVIPLDEFVFNTEAHPIRILNEPFDEWKSFFEEFSNE
jgi:mannosyl-oligosaccharide alpha-1,2-mannosidase